MKPRVIVTRRWPAAVEQILAERFDTTFNQGDAPLGPTELKAAFLNFDAILPTVSDKLPAAVFPDADIRTKILANFGVGFSHIDTDAARARGIAVTNTPGVLTDCTADIGMNLLLSVARRAGEGERQLRAGQWTGWCPTHLVGAKVTGKTLGIIGMGRIGKAMAKRAHFGFDMDIVFYTARRSMTRRPKPWVRGSWRPSRMCWRIPISFRCIALVVPKTATSSTQSVWRQ
jgi:lactate dehydrogenase-like 2-hydroxyacid dehydrogenase